ncbi:MAG: phosphoglycerate kinase [Candidatus Dormiibacterota bacterium]
MKAGLDDFKPEGRRVLVRVDFNVPLREDGSIRDDARMRAALPTIRELIDGSAKVVVATHLGRPKGRVVPGLSTRPLAQHLGQLLGREVAWCPECVGSEAEAAVAELPAGGVLMLENLRFHPEEEANDPEFSAQLARLADVYVNDAFGTAHRAHASTVGVAHRLPAYAGRLMERELGALGGILEDPVQPLLAVLGGSKLSTKLGVIDNLLPRVTQLFLGGGMAATFLKAEGMPVGRSLVEPDFVPRAADLLGRAPQLGAEVELPSDVVVANSPEAGPGAARVCAVSEVGPEDMILDVGPRTLDRWVGLVSRAGTVVWNGPLGVYENPAFATGTRRLAEAIAASPAVSVTGGGDLQAALEALGLSSGFTHVSTGGGATLEFLEGRELPGVAALREVVVAR